MTEVRMWAWLGFGGGSSLTMQPWQSPLMWSQHRDVAATGYFHLLGFNKRKVFPFQVKDHFPVCVPVLNIPLLLRKPQQRLLLVLKFNLFEPSTLNLQSKQENSKQLFNKQSLFTSKIYVIY